ncbi:hypothetical protein GT94_03710 [Geobacillus stearothermophilus]|nr:hypothetical protein ET31_08690 [Geobacillus stearothermophilus]KFX36096.1 hypothetical protein GT94_03710 [Geobacillus stearothermophilus]WJQ00659.1 hypothetical protein QT234_01800 [Geobacillus stearothermophilus]WJQ04069.1 hypothetical protein QT236_01780 [Geobacillus stearothermophilus]WJQ10940.1 hypothetical protein QT237_01815 [Geobacillus stearothermophilus]
MGPSAPLWMSMLYYLMCTATLLAGVMMLVKGTVRRLYSLAAVLAVPLFFLNNFHTIARVGVDPFDYWQQSLAKGQWWAWLSLALFLYIVWYWGLLVQRIGGKKEGQAWWKRQRWIWVVLAAAAPVIVYWVQNVDDSIVSSVRTYEPSKDNLAEDPSSAHIFFLYSHPLEREAYIAEADWRGMRQLAELKAVGISHISPAVQTGELLLWSDYVGRHVYQLNPDTWTAVRKEEVSAPLSFLSSDGKWEIQSINQDVKTNVVRFKKEGKEAFSKRFPPYVLQVLHDGRYFYVFVDDVEEEHGALYVVDQNGSLVKELPLPTKTARSMVMFQHRLVLTTEPSLTIVDPRTWQVMDWDMGQEETRFDQLQVKGDTLWVSYVQREKSGWIALNDRFKVMEKHELPSVYWEARFHGDYVYILFEPQEGNKADNAGEMNIFQLRTAQLAAKFTVPKQKHNLQTFYVMDEIQ